MIAEAIAEKIETAGIHDNVNIGELPIEKMNGVSVVYIMSPPPNTAIPFYVQLIDIRTRYVKFDEGYRILTYIFDLFHGKQNYTMGDYHVYLSYANGMPMDEDRDIKRQHMGNLSLGFIYRKL